MSVDSFIQQRISLDASSTSEHTSSAATTPHRATFRLHQLSSNNPSLVGSGTPEPAVDPRWQMAPPNNADAQHAFFKSIESELPETDRIAIQHASASRQQQLLQQEAAAGGGGPTKRHSVLRGKTKQLTKLPIGVASGAVGSGGVLNASASSIPGTTTGYPEGGRAASTSISSTRRPAVFSSGSSAPPQQQIHSAGSSSSGHLPSTSTSGPSTANSLGRRANAPGPINVANNVRTRTHSLGGGSTSSAGASSTAGNATAVASGSSYAQAHPLLPPLRLATDHGMSPVGEAPDTAIEDTSEYCIAIIGSQGCGKSMLVKKIVKRYTVVEQITFNVGDSVVYSTVLHVDVSDNTNPQSVRVLEVDSALVAYPDNLWPPELPRIDGVLLCYDASNEDSFTRIPELLAGYHALGHALVILACKSDLHRAVSPSRANAIGREYDIGLIEVSITTDAGKGKIRNCFVWEIKAIGRHRRNAAKNAIPPYRNPASPEILQGSRSPWDSISNGGTPTGAQSSAMATALFNSRHQGSQSSVTSGTQLFRQAAGAAGVGGSASNSAPVLPLADTYAQSSSISHSTGGTGTGTGTSSLNGTTDHNALSPSVPSTARTSFDSVVMTGGAGVGAGAGGAGAGTGGAGASAIQQPLAPNQRPPSSASSGPPPSSSRTRSTSDALSTAAKVPSTGVGVGVSTIPTPSPSPHVPVAMAGDSNADTTPITNSNDDLGDAPGPDATSPLLEVGSGPGTAVPAGGGSGPVIESARTQREGSSLQWATLDEILDKLLFVSVSGDDPVFIQHFFLTYRRFATPRSVLLGMQKRMIELGKETRDPLLAKFAQMRICNLLSQWKENYPHDFGAPGTFGALQALLKQVVSNVHLVHYASDLIPFLDDIPKLEDRESTWCKKEETVGGDDSEDESANGTDDEIIPRLEDDDETYVGRGGGAFERRTRTPASSNPTAPQGRTLSAGPERPYHAAGSNSAPNVATSASNSVEGSNALPPLPNRSVASSTPGFQPESVFTYDRVVGRTARVNVKELQRISLAIISLETVHIAQEITRRMLVLFKRIEARDWLRRTMSKKDYVREKDPIGQLTRLFNYLVCWVSAMIVCFDKVEKRARAVDKMVVIAKALRQLNNYMGMNAFVAGINNVRGSDDEELTQTLASRPNSNWKQFKSLQMLVGTARSGQTYRTALKHTAGAAIPDLERHGSDIFRAEEGNLDYSRTDPNLIHWGKFTILGKLVGTVTLYQNRCHTMADYRDLEERPLISELVFNQVVWDLETLINREHRAWEEAQTTESSSTIRKLLPFKV